MTTTSGPPGGPRPHGAGTGRRRPDAPALVSRRREHLVRLAADLFAQKGYQATTVRDIAQEAGILSGSLYHHFDSKESIVDEILSAYFDDVVPAYRKVVGEGGNPRATLEGLVRAAFAALEPHRAAITVMQNDWNHLQGLDRFAYLIRAEDEAERMWVEAITAGQAGGLFRDDIDARLTYLMIRDTVRVAVRWAGPGGRLDTRGLADHYLKVMFDGVNVH